VEYVRLIAFAAFYSCTFAFTAFSAEKSVLVIHSYAPNMWTKRLDEGLVERAKKLGYRLEPYYYHSTYWESAPETDRLSESARILSKAKDPKYIGYIVADDEASVAFRQSLTNLGRPIIFTGLNHARHEDYVKPFCGSSPHSTALLEEYPYGEALSIYLKNFKRPARYVMAGSEAPTAEHLINGLKRYAQEKYPDMKLVREIRSKSWETWKRELKEVDSQVDFVWIFVPFGVRDRLNEEIAPSRVGQWLVQNLNTIKIGANILSKSIDMTIGLDAVDLGIETMDLFHSEVQGKNTQCPVVSKSYKINLNKRTRSTQL
jgi:hypothetical protein